MLPSTKLLVTAALPFCLWKPSTAPLPAVLLDAPKTTLPFAVIWPLAVMGAVEAKVVTAFTVSVLLLLLPNIASPSALNALPAVTVTSALAVMGAVEAKVVTAFTVRLLTGVLLVLPKTELPSALNKLPGLTVTAALAVMIALAVMDAVGAKVVAALTVRVLLPLAPRTMLPFAVRAALAVMGAVDAKVVAEFTVKAVAVPLPDPSTVLPSELKRFPAETVRAALAVTDDVKVVTALTVSL